MNKTTIIPATLFLFSISSQSNTDLPDMQMHIFEGESKTAESTSMQMVIFSTDEAAEQEKSASGEDLKLAYSDNGQLSVYSEDSQYDTVEVEDDQEIAIEFYLDAGYRYDELDWNKADTDGSPNILSELSWDDIQIAVVEIGGSIQTPSRWVMDARFAYGTIFSGHNQDSDYFGDNRTQEFSRSNNNADEGSTIDTSIGFGYKAKVIPGPARFKKPIFSITPRVGYSFHAQNLTATDGKQTVPAKYTFSGLDSKYDTTWHAGQSGLKALEIII